MIKLIYMRCINYYFNKNKLKINMRHFYGLNIVMHLLLYKQGLDVFLMIEFNLILLGFI